MNNKTQILLTILLGNAVMDVYSNRVEYPLEDVQTEKVKTAFINRLHAEGYRYAEVYMAGGEFAYSTTYEAVLTLGSDEEYTVRVTADGGSMLHFVHLGLLQDLFSTAVKRSINVSAVDLGEEEIADEKRRLVEEFTEITRDLTQEIRITQMVITPISPTAVKASMLVVMGHGPETALVSFKHSDGTVDPAGFDLDSETPVEKTEAVVHTVEFPVGTFLRLHREEQGLVVIGHSEDQVILRRMQPGSNGEYVVDDEPTSWEMENLLKVAIEEFRPATFAEREALVQQMAIDLLTSGVSDKRLVDSIKNTIGQALASTSTIYDAAAGLKQIERLPLPVLNTIKFMIGNNKLIPAIKVVRTFTNLGLKPAKDLTEVLMDKTGDMTGHYYSMAELNDMLVYSVSENHDAVVEIFGEGPKGERWDEYFSNMTL